MNINLFPKQYQAFMSKATELLYGGAAGGGKSYLIRCALIMWCSVIPGLQCYLFRRTFPDLQKNHMEGPSSFPVLLAQWVEDKMVNINWSDMSIKFWNGSTIFLCHCQYEKDMYKYQGAEMHVLVFDELTHFTKTIYAFLRSRVRMTGIKVPEQFRGAFPRVLAGSNPGGIGHNWVKLTFVDAARPNEIWQAPDEDGGLRRQFIPARLDDNPALLLEDPKYFARLEGLGNPALVKAMRNGDWNIISGGMFDDVWREDIHVVEPFRIPDTWIIDRAFDWGSSKPFSVGWWAESDGSRVQLADGSWRTFPRGSLFLIKEWYGWNGRPNEGLKMDSVDIARGIKEREAFMHVLDRLGRMVPARVRPGPADTSIFDATDGRSIASEMMREKIKWELADKSPGSRKTGWLQIRAMLKEFTKENPELPCLAIFAGCNNWVRNVPSLPRLEKDPDDVDSDAEDHDGDMTRYRVMFKRLEGKVRTLGGM